MNNTPPIDYWNYITMFLTCMITSAVTIKVCKLQEGNKFAKQCLDEAYIDLFALIEPVLYKPIPLIDCDRIVEEILGICIEKNIL